MIGPLPAASLRRVMAHGFAPGKIFLLGEHALAAGHPALVATLPRGTSVWAERAGECGFLVESANGVRAQLAAAAQLVGAHFGIVSARVRIESDLPIGQGLGASAAFSVALCRALAALSGRTVPLAELCSLALEAQSVFEGRASSVDTTAAALGGVLSLRRGPPPVVEAVALARPALLVVALTEPDQGGRARARAAADRLRLTPGPSGWLLTRLGEHAQRGTAELARGDFAGLGARLDEVHALLASSGLSSPTVDRAVAILRASGVRGAKLAGSAGAVVALVDDAAPALSALHDRGVAAFSLSLDAARFAA